MNEALVVLGKAPLPKNKCQKKRICLRTDSSGVPKLDLRSTAEESLKQVINAEVLLQELDGLKAEYLAVSDKGGKSFYAQPGLYIDRVVSKLFGRAKAENKLTGLMHLVPLSDHQVVLEDRSIVQSLGADLALQRLQGCTAYLQDLSIATCQSNFIARFLQWQDGELSSSSTTLSRIKSHRFATS